MAKKFTSGQKTETEIRVRTAAIAAARGVPLGEGFLGEVVAKTSDPNLSPAEREALAINMTRDHVGAEKPLNVSATPNEQLALQALAKGALGQGHHPKHRLPGTADAADTDSGSGAKYDGMSSKGVGSEAYFNEMRGHAIKHGLGWAADNRDILRLGPAAIETLAKANIKKESFERFKAVGFSAQNAVAAAKWANDNGKDGNEVSVRIFGGNDPAEQKRWRDLFNNFYADPNNPKAQQEMGEALKREQAHADPKRREQARKTEQLLKLGTEVKNDADVRDERAQARVQNEAAKMADDLNEVPKSDAASQPKARAAEAVGSTGEKQANKSKDDQKLAVRPVANQRVAQAATPRPPG